MSEPGRPAPLVVAAAAAACWAAGVWCAGGTLAVIGASPAATRVGLLPPLARLLGLLVLAGVVAAAPRVRCLPLAPLALSALTVLPWIPGAPAPWLLWTGPAAYLVWLAVAVGMAGAHEWSGLSPLAARLWRRARDPRRAPWVASAAGLALFATAAWRVAPSVPGGDEPHYLIITQSLLCDFDLKIENNHQRRDYAPYFPAGELKPDYLQRGRDGQIYSVHAPGLPALVAPAFAAAGYPGVKAFLLLASALGAGLVWTLAFRVSGDAGAAWFGWAAVCLSPSWIFHTFTVYPDGIGAVLLLAAVSMLAKLHRGADPEGPRGRTLALTGAALALLPWLHTRFVLLAAPLGLVLAARLVGRYGWRAGGRAAAVLFTVPALSAAGWFAFFYVIYGTISPLAPYGTFFRTQASWAFVTSGIGGLLFDQQFGLLPYAPVLAAAAVGLGRLARDARERRVAVELLLVMVPYLVSVTHFRMWWAGWSAPARFFVPVLLPLAGPAAVAWARAHRRATRATLVAALAFTLFAAGCLVLVEGGRLAYNVRDGYALWLDWLSQTTELALGLPSFHRTPEGTAWGHVAIWVAALALGWSLLVGVERLGGADRRRLAAATPAVYAACAMAALATVWWSNGTSGLSPAASQLELIRRAAAWRGLAVADRPVRVIDLAAVPGLLRIEVPRRWLSARERAVFAAPNLPAGVYSLDVAVRGESEGELRIGVGRDELAVRTVPLAAAGRSGVAVDLRLPVAVRALVVRADAAAYEAVSRVVLRPRALRRLPPPLAGVVARQAAAYPGGTVYFLDDGAFAEPGAFWIRGGGAAAVVLDTPGRPGVGGRVAPLFLRNGPVDNQVVIEVGAWRERLALAPRQERMVEVPLLPDGGAVLVHLSARSGFRPAEWEPDSRDHRFLGVWVELRR